MFCFLCNSRRKKELQTLIENLDNLFKYEMNAFIIQINEKQEIVHSALHKMLSHKIRTIDDKINNITTKIDNMKEIIDKDVKLNINYDNILTNIVMNLEKINTKIENLESNKLITSTKDNIQKINPEQQDNKQIQQVPKIYFGNIFSNLPDTKVLLETPRSEAEYNLTDIKIDTIKIRKKYQELKQQFEKEAEKNNQLVDDIIMLSTECDATKSLNEQLRAIIVEKNNEILSLKSTHM